MPAAANIYRPSLSSVPALGEAPQSAAAGNGNAFAATLDKYLHKAEATHRAAQNRDAGPLTALTQLLQNGLLGKQSKLSGLNDLAGLRTETQKLQSQFQADFRRLLSEQGIDIGSGVSLQVDAGGEIRVINDHPDKLFIESALKNDPQLSNLFRKLSANASLLHAADSATSFQQSYRVNPQTALSEHEDLFGKRTPQTYSLTITSDGVQEAFTMLQANASQPIL